jgi:cephalosporin hydroxylase
VILPTHERIEYVTGSSTDPQTLDRVKKMMKVPNPSVMVMLDSDHRKPHVLNEMELYSPLVSKGSYLIVEDTNMGHPIIAVGYGDGPMEAVVEFLQKHDDFSPDRDREKFLLTFNPMGYLKRIK